MIESLTMPSTLGLKELYRPVAVELDQVRGEVSALWAEVLGIVQEQPAGPPPVGGKLLRPALCLLSAGALGAPDLGRFVKLAASMEVFHVAALAHDDVIDGASLRRGMESLNAMWTDHAAVLGGDYLVARGIALMAEYGSCDMIRDGVQCIRQMAEGELTDFGRGPGHFTEDGCIELARAKTASLFAVACGSPCHLIDREHLDSLWDFGLSLGVGFQIIDDLLDLCQVEEVLGKPACGDLAAGKKTLPLLYLRDGLDDAGTARLASLRDAELTAEDRTWVASMLEKTGARQHAADRAREYVVEAQGHLRALSDSPFRDAMCGLTEFVLTRGS
ncbi:MAG: polyprenyl synthetase family protein [bacterium]|nr:polyprenyl synthetase family protein [bacterium]